MSAKKKNHLFLGFFIAGLAFLLSSWFITLKTDSFKKNSDASIARIEHETGKVFLLKSSPFFKVKVEKTEKASNFDSLQTDEVGEANINLQNGYKVKVFENSLVTLERQNTKEADRFFLTVKKGNVRIENFGPENNLWISRDGQKIPAAEYNTSEWVNIQATSDKTTIEKTIDDVSGLTEEEISATMSLNRNYFFKCYTQLLQTNNQAKGEVSLSFTIENDGKVSVSEATSTTLNDPHFKRCLLEVVNRIEFKSFSGPSISTLFPLKFE